MAKVAVYNLAGEQIKEVELDPKIFGIEINPELVQHAVVVQQANSRNNLASVKDRSEVSGGGKKPWKQKGTGRARHGSSRSPIWRGGGVTFGPSNNRNFSLKINKKAKRKALLMTISDKATNKKIILLDKLELEEVKTKKFFEILKNLKLRSKKDVKKSVSKDKEQDLKDEGKTKEIDNKKKSKVKEPSILIVTPTTDEKIKRVARNISRTKVIQANSLNVVDVLKHKYLLMPLDSVKSIEKTFISASVSTSATPYAKASGVKKASMVKKAKVIKK